MKQLFVGGVSASTSYTLDQLWDKRIPTVREQLESFGNGVYYTGWFMNFMGAGRLVVNFLKNSVVRLGPGKILFGNKTGDTVRMGAIGKGVNSKEAVQMGEKQGLNIKRYSFGDGDEAFGFAYLKNGPKNPAINSGELTVYKPYNSGEITIVKPNTGFVPYKLPNENITPKLGPAENYPMLPEPKPGDNNPVVQKKLLDGVKSNEVAVIDGVSYASSEEMARIGAPIGHIGYPKDIVLHEPPYSVASDLSHVIGKGAHARNKAIIAIMNEDLKDINLSVTPQYNPFLTSGISQVKDVGPICQIGKMQFSNRNDLIDIILHEELHNRLKMDGVYGEEYQSVFQHHPPRGVVVQKEKFLEFVKMWIEDPTEETYNKILELAKKTKKWWE